MDNIFNELIGLLNNSGVVLKLISVLIVIAIGLISIRKDILDFKKTEKEKVYYTLINYLLKDSLSDKKNIIKIEYKLNNDVKSLWHEFDRLRDKSDFKFFTSQKCIIPIKILCNKKDSLLAKEISDIKIDSATLKKTLIILQEEQKAVGSFRSAIDIYLETAKKQKPSSFFLNAGLYNAFVRNLLSTIQFKETVSETMIGAMLNKKAKDYTKSYIYLSLALIIYPVISILINMRIEPFLMYANIFFLALTFINQKILEFRIAKGYYGSNEYEAREMMQFITENSSGSNFSGGTGLKPFPAEDASRAVWLEGCVTV